MSSIRCSENFTVSLPKNGSFRGKVLLLGRPNTQSAGLVHSELSADIKPLCHRPLDVTEQPRRKQAVLILEEQLSKKQKFGKQKAEIEQRTASLQNWVRLPPAVPATEDFHRPRRVLHPVKHLEPNM
jgi:hypothetical protein